MEPGVRKILPRAPPSGADRDSESAAADALRNGNGVLENATPGRIPGWRYATEDDGPPKRKRQHLEENSPRQHPLPSFRQMMPSQSSQQPLLDNERAGPARLQRTGYNTYNQQGTLRFLAPRPPRDFPPAIYNDPRELSFATVEPELMEVFKHAYYLRQHIRPKRLSGAVWSDQIYFNDAFAIDNILRTWISRYEPGMLQYPASILYKQCLWIFFNRTVQVSESTAAFRHMVDDGLHFLRTFENELGANGDRSVLLIPIFVLGSTSFYAGQRQEIWTSLNRLDPSYSIDAVMHAAKSLERIWEMMDDGRVSATWDWEKYQAHDYAMAQADRSLIELLWDPLARPPQVQRLRSPETYEFDPGRFRAAAVPIPPPLEHRQQSQDTMQDPREEREEVTPPHPNSHSPPRRRSSASNDTDAVRVDSNQDSNHSHPEVATTTPRPFIAPHHAVLIGRRMTTLLTTSSLLASSRVRRKNMGMLWPIGLGSGLLRRSFDSALCEDLECHDRIATYQRTTLPPSSTPTRTTTPTFRQIQHVRHLAVAERMSKGSGLRSTQYEVATNHHSATLRTRPA